MRDSKRSHIVELTMTTRGFLLTAALILVLSLLVVYLLTPVGQRLGFWIQVLLAVGGAALVVIAMNIADRLVFTKVLAGGLEDAVRTQLDERMSLTPWSTGVIASHPSLSGTKFAEIMGQESGAEICILDTYIPDPMFISTKMEEALKNGCRFKFLVLEPRCEQVKQRAALLADQGLGQDQFEHGTLIYVCTIGGVGTKLNAFDRIAVRFYEEPPVIPIYMIRYDRKDRRHQHDKLFFGFYTDKASYANYHLEVARVGAPLFEMLEDYFDRMWERNAGGEVNLAEYVKTKCPIAYKQKSA